MMCLSGMGGDCADGAGESCDVDSLREELDVSEPAHGITPALESIPIFLGHGTDDEKGAGADGSRGG